MTTSRGPQLTQQRTAEAIDEPRPARSERPAPEVPGHSRTFLGTRARVHPIRTAADEAEHVYELERAGESEWTPWIALAVLIVFFAAVGLLMFGIIEAGSHLLTSATSAR